MVMWKGISKIDGDGVHNKRKLFFKRDGKINELDNKAHSRSKS